jgi:ribonucleoside-diphosphate reductase alpha chain
MSLQYGVPLEVYVSKFSHTRFEPMGYTKNPDIRIAKSIVDYIFRWLGITFLPGYREAMRGQVEDTTSLAKEDGEDAESERKLAAMKAGEPKPGPGTAEPAISRGDSAGLMPAKNGSLRDPVDASLLDRAGVKVDLNGGPPSGRADQFARFQTDAPACDNCGAITVRNGNCYLCHNCGNSMGCS